MPERDGFPAGVPAWVDSSQPDPAAATAFYGGLFGWQFEERGGGYSVATLDGKTVTGIASASATGRETPDWTTYVAVDDVETAAQRVRDAGGTVVGEPADRLGLARVALCTDPEGAAFGLWEPGTIRGAGAVNAPGSWNFSELHAADADGAKRFYASVFGWQFDEVDMGAMTGTMVRMPGYADFLEAINPGTKQRHIDFGAPPGFTECVAWFLPLDEGTAPHWSITFSVADADATAARARELGGMVLVEPFDMPMVRSTVIRDRAGATITANAFVPG